LHLIDPLRRHEDFEALAKRDAMNLKRVILAIVAAVAILLLLLATLRLEKGQDQAHFHAAQATGR
jgi:hypothetical protein